MTWSPCICVVFRGAFVRSRAVFPIYLAWLFSCYNFSWYFYLEVSIAFLLTLPQNSFKCDSLCLSYKMYSLCYTCIVENHHCFATVSAHFYNLWLPCFPSLFVLLFFPKTEQWNLIIIFIYLFRSKSCEKRSKLIGVVGGALSIWGFGHLQNRPI